MNYYNETLDTIEDEQLIKVYIGEFELFTGVFREFSKHKKLEDILDVCLIESLKAKNNFLILHLVKE